MPRSSGSCSEAFWLGYQAEKSVMRLKLPLNFVRSKSAVQSCPALTHLAKLTSLRLDKVRCLHSFCQSLLKLHVMDVRVVVLVHACLHFREARAVDKRAW